MGFNSGFKGLTVYTKCVFSVNTADDLVISLQGVYFPYVCRFLGLNPSQVSHMPLPIVIFHTERAAYWYLSSVWVGDSVVGTATRYWLGDTGTQSRWR